MTRREQLVEWIDTLTPEQVKQALVEVVEDAIETEVIRLHKGDAPYWDICGELLGGKEMKLFRNGTKEEIETYIKEGFKNQPNFI